ncbi:hypothetical protein KBZ10_09385 [Streptomyces sp. F63]|uniref:hypothetical protein n=1 Tax=Streptomyces sp. F63 TaxID=2824887 RepID=UPI001B37F3B5|nr:hypothetical protein [Streptomyces sp. F63]MBQ0984725.1 hypothetical protein [Streptomyces sp. F63]
MSYCYVLQFNLAQRGEEAREYLLEAARTWPRLWGSIPGVTGTLLLSNALALGGEFEYQWRVDIESLDTLSRIDRTIASGENGWREATREWFRNRTDAEAYVCDYIGESGTYCREHPGTDAAIHLIVRPSGGGSGAETASSARLRQEGVVSVRVLRPVLGRVASGEIWVRLAGLHSLDEVVPATSAIGPSLVFGEIREVDGAFFAGA